MLVTDRMRIAFVKYAGMTAGGTERWLQTMAAHLPRDRFDVTYFWSDSVPEIGSSRMAPPTDPNRLAYMRDAGVELVEFHLEALDLRRATAPWKETDFWELFDPKAFDLVQTSKVGVPEYPFVDMPVPVFEQVAYNGGVDRTPSIVRSGHWSEWSRAWWCRRGGRLDRSFVHPIPAAPPAATGDLRSELGIDRDTLVVGFHQRQDDRTMSPVQLAAVARLRSRDVAVVVLGGSALYQEQARGLGLERCHFLPATSDPARISRFLQTLDVYTHGRRDGETFGLALAEAMTHGRPCLSHRVPGNANAQRETIGPGGEVVDDVDGYTIALRALLDDQARRILIGQRGRQHATARFSTTTATEALAAEYDAFIAGRPPPKTWGFGEVAEGFLLSGTVEDPDDPAAAVVTGVLRDGGLIAALRKVLPVAPPGSVDLTTDLRSVALWLACHRDHGRKVTVHESELGACLQLQADLRLNGAEEAVELRHHEACSFAPSDAARAQLQTSGVLVVGARGLAAERSRPRGDLTLVRGSAGPAGRRWSVAGSPDLVRITRRSFQRQAAANLRTSAARAAARRVLPVRQRLVQSGRAALAAARSLR